MPALPPGTPWAPVPYEDADVAAFQALAAGTADDVQQKRALDWLMLRAAGTYDFHYYSSERDTSFALGRAFVGQQIRKLLTINLSRIAERTGVQNAVANVQSDGTRRGGISQRRRGTIVG